MKHKKSVEAETIGPKKKKILTAPSKPEVIDISEKEKEELEKTKSELDIEEQKLICIVHKGQIVGAMYACPMCKTLYCIWIFTLGYIIFGIWRHLTHKQSNGNYLFYRVENNKLT